MPDHPTATPREVFGNPEQLPAPTMASSIEWLEQECTRIDSTAAALRLEQELAAPSGSWWQALERNREPLETLAAHYRNALAAMRAVEAIESGRVHGVRRGYSERSGEFAADADGLLGYVYAPSVAEAVALAAAFPTPPARDV